MNKHLAPFVPRPFKAPETLPGSLSATVAASLLGTVGDIAMVLDQSGVILDVAIAEADLVARGFEDMIGQQFADTLTIESHDKVVAMMTDAANGTPARWRQVNHHVSGGDVPVRYLIVALGQEGRLIAIGRDMRSAAVMQQRLLQSQQSLERDYIRLRQAEARYRLLFDLAADPVLIVDASTRRIREANPSACRMFGLKESGSADQQISGLVDPQDRDAFMGHLGAAEASDTVVPITLRLRNGQGTAQFSARLFRQARTALLLVRVTTNIRADGHEHDSALRDVVERMPDAFVVADRNLNILTANSAFVEMAEMSSVDRVRGAKLGQWLGRPGIDLDLIVGQLREHDVVRNVAAVLITSSGAQEEIEVSAVVAPTEEGDCYGFSIRNVGRRLRAAPAVDPQLPRSVEQLTGLVGRMSLKEIVRESTDLIERLCIEAALSYTSDNRASAAEILGVSRQSLYSKLHRHGLGNLVSDGSE
ncbi:MAG: transcriptional regulator PpsR [Sphingomonas sp.]